MRSNEARNIGEPYASLRDATHRPVRRDRIGNMSDSVAVQPTQRSSEAVPSILADMSNQLVESSKYSRFE